MTPSTIFATSIFSLAILYVLARSMLASLAFSRTSKNSRMSPSRFIFSKLYPDSDKIIFFLISSSSDRVGFMSLKAMCSPYRVYYGDAYYTFASKMRWHPLLRSCRHWLLCLFSDVRRVIFLNELPVNSVSYTHLRAH